MVNAVVEAIQRLAPDPRVAEAMLLGSHLESGWRANAVGDRGTSFGPFQIHLPAHPGVSAAEAQDPTFAVRYMLPAYEHAVASVPASLWRSDPEQAAELAAYRAERPAQIYHVSRGQATVDRAWRDVLAVLRGQPIGAGSTPGGADSSTGGAETAGLNPLSGVADALGGFTQTVKTLAFVVPFVVAGAALVVWGLARATGASKLVTRELDAPARLVKDNPELLAATV